MSTSTDVPADRFETFFEQLADELFLLTPDGDILNVNERTCTSLGFHRDDLIGDSVLAITPEGAPEWWLNATTATTDAGASTKEARFLRSDGTTWPAEVRITVIHERHQTMVLAVARDMSQRLRLEAQLRQGTKMEAVGRLAGGVAHDFNNLLTVILTYSQFLLEDLDETSPMQQDVLEIREAANRASALTHRLLAFSRRQVLEPEVLDWTGVVLDLLPLLRRLIGEDVELVTDLDNDPSKFVGDPGQLSQVLMNLAVNARDAMPSGGRIALTTSDIHIDLKQARKLNGMRPGRYACLTVEDAGDGMLPEILHRIFEPFFTTKSDGTGLGLAMVYGIVKQSEGYIYADSTPQEGTCFKIYMPMVSEHHVATQSRPIRLRGDGSGTEVILLVEDEDLVRNVAIRALARAGYKVLSARNAGEALLLFERHGDEIDLLATDVVMPHMGGGELATRLLDQRADLPVLYMTGYTDDAIVRHGIGDKRASLLHKPFTPEGLTLKVREILDQRPPEKPPENGRSRILIVDEDSNFRTALRRLLRGLDVHEAANNLAARKQLRRGYWDVVLCSSTVQASNGKSLLAWLEGTRPDLQDRVVVMGTPPEGIAVPKVTLPRPVDPDDVSQLVQDMVAEKV